jgi:hypothetical protein
MINCSASILMLRGIRRTLIAARLWINISIVMNSDIAISNAVAHLEGCWICFEHF